MNILEGGLNINFTTDFPVIVITNDVELIYTANAAPAGLFQEEEQQKQSEFIIGTAVKGAFHSSAENRGAHK